MTGGSPGATLSADHHPAEKAMAEGGGIGQALIDEIVRRILTVAKPDRIILFGSAATGEMTPDSDIDVLVIEPHMEPRAESRHREMIRIREAIGRIGYPVDVIVISTERFEWLKDIVGGIEYPADKYGRVVYDAA